MYFLVKRPGWLAFNPAEYADEEVRGLQVRHRDGKSNTKLVEFADGNWYLQNGGRMFLLKSMTLKNEMGIGRRDEDVLHVEEIVDCKWFVRSDEKSH